MWNPLRKPLIALVLSAAGLAPTAAAQELSVSFGKETRHGHFGLQFSTAGPSTSHVYRQNRGKRESYKQRAPQRVWVPGHYEVVHEKVWVEGRTRREYVQPVFETRFLPCGTSFQVQISAGYWHTVREPGYWTTRARKVWRPGCWQYHGGHYR